MKNIEKTMKSKQIAIFEDDLRSIQERFRIKKLAF